MAQYEQLSAGTGQIFPITVIQAIHSDNVSIGGGDANEALSTLLGRMFTRIQTLETQVNALLTRLALLETQVSVVQQSVPIEHFSIELYTHTTGSYPNRDDYAGANYSKLFTNTGYILTENQLNANGWFFSAQEAYDADQNTATTVWGITIEVSKEDDSYKVYPSVSDFKYNPSMMKGDALMATFEGRLSDIDATYSGQVSDLTIQVNDLADDLEVAETTVVAAVQNTVDTAVNTKVSEELSALGLTQTAWNSIQDLATQYTGTAFETKLNNALTAYGWGSSDRTDMQTNIANLLSDISGLTADVNTLTSDVNDLTTDPTTFMSTTALLNKLADTTESLTFVDGAVSKTRTAKERLSELVFGSDTNDDAITSDTFIVEKGLTDLKVAIAGAESANDSFQTIIKRTVGLDQSSIAEIVVAAVQAGGSGSGGGTAIETDDSIKPCLRISNGGFSLETSTVPVISASETNNSSQVNIEANNIIIGGNIGLLGSISDPEAVSLEFTDNNSNIYQVTLLGRVDVTA